MKIMHEVMENIQMVDVASQYAKIKNEIDYAIQEVIDSSIFIKGPVVSQFENMLAKYLNAAHVIGCANGTDALQIALMALNLQPGDEIIVPSFTYVATAEVIVLLGLKPVMIDVDVHSYNSSVEHIKPYITSKTRVIVPVHLFGQSADMEAIMQLADEYNLYVIEDNAQAIGADYIFSDGTKKKTGTIGHIGTTSFYPSKNLGCYGDGGAIFTQDDELGMRIRKIANHGQDKRYYHDIIGVNSRLDAIQAAVLNVKLKYLDEYCAARVHVADRYDQAFAQLDDIHVPLRVKCSTHVFHQYTLRVQEGKRDTLLEYLKGQKVPSMIYYPVPLYRQGAFDHYYDKDFSLDNTETLCAEVMSLPIHTEMEPDVQNYIIEHVINGIRI